jgi:glycerol-3-phosphate dehydrogenase subunit B
VSSRVVVVGGGLAGSAAALELARQDVETTLVCAEPGATALGWGTLDVAAAVPGSRRLRWRLPLREAPLVGTDRLAILIGTFPSHPYARIFGRDARSEAGAAAELVKEAVADLAAALSPRGLAIEGSLDENRLLADAHGVVRVSDFAFGPAAGGDLAERSELAWVSLAGLPADPAPVALRRLAAERAALGLAPVPTRSVALRLPDALPTDSPARLAAALDRPEAFDELVRTAEAAREDAGAGRLWLFPPVLGLDRAAANLAALRERLGAPVAETLAAVPDATPGYRLHRALDEAGAEVLLDADAVVLATGRFLGGGLCERDGAVEERVLGLPVVDGRGERVDGRPARASVRRRYLDLHPLFAAGVATDARLRPVSGAEKTPVAPNLFAAGDLLAGFDPARDRTGLGVALATGVVAARHAASAAREDASAP